MFPLVQFKKRKKLSNLQYLFIVWRDSKYIKRFNIYALMTNNPEWRKSTQFVAKMGFCFNMEDFNDLVWICYVFTVKKCEI